MEEIYSRDYINKIIGNNVRFIRKSNKLSQEQFAEKIDLSTQFVSDLERGVEGISLNTAIKICNIMKCSPVVLFANLINYDNYNNKMDEFINLTDKNKDIIIEIMTALLNSQ